MGIEARDVYLLSPEIALTALALLVVALDLITRSRAVQTAVAVAGLAAPVALTIVLWADVGAKQEAAFSGSLVVDQFALFFKLLIAGVLALVLLASRDTLSRFRYQAEFVGLAMLSAAGLMLLAAAGDLVTIYVSLELASLPIVALAAFIRGQVRSVEAGMKYLVLSAVSSATLLMGFAWLYGATGSVQVVGVEGAAPPIIQMIGTGDPAVPFGSFALMVGIVLSLAGFGFKLSMVPFHMWTPDVYEGAPTPVAAFLAVASKAAAFAVVLRVLYTALGLDELSADWTVLIAILAAVTMSVGNIVAVIQRNFKRLLGYSAIAHAGYMLIGVAAFAGRAQEAGDASLGSSSVLFYLGGYAAMNLAAFFVVTVVVNRTGDERVAGLAGLGQRAPWAAAVLAIALVSLTGIPPTVGFMGKLFLFQAAINADLMWLALLGAVNSVVSAYYYLNVVRVMYLREAPSPDGERVAVGPTAGVALAVTTAGVLLLGVWPNGLLDVARNAVQTLL